MTRGATTSSPYAAEPPALTIGRLQYDGGGDWYGNPSSLPNLLSAIRQRTALQVEPRERVVTLHSEEQVIPCGRPSLPKAVTTVTPVGKVAMNGRMS